MQNDPTHVDPLAESGHEIDIHAASEFPPPEDSLERLWTPHRMVYIGGENKPKDKTEGACPFCNIDPAQDVEQLVVARGETCFVILNLYPYNPGHLMVVPYRHVSSYIDLTQAETDELARLTQTAIRVLTATSNPQGFNLGMNQGDVAGAGIAAHLHQHVVPRWTGDANFLPIIAQTKAVPQLLADTRDKLASAWPVGGANRQ